MTPATNKDGGLHHSRLEQRLPILNHGSGLHIGTVQYNYIGALDRSDSTVIGQTVNLASRIEGLCSKFENSHVNLLLSHKSAGADSSCLSIICLLQMRLPLAI